MKILFVATFDQFIKPIAEKLRGMGFQCDIVNNFVREEVGLYDVIWCEWADQNAIKVQEYLTPAKKILRAHNYEMYNGMIERILPKEWASIIFISNYQKRLAEEKLQIVMPNAKVIPNYIDTIKFQIPEGKEPNNKIAFAGFLERKKGIGEILLLAASFPDHEFHLKGTFHEPDVSDYLKEVKPKNVFIYPWGDDLPEFFKDKTYYINTSMREGCCVAMLEAMCAGLKPLVRNWISSDEIYGDDFIWSSYQDVKDLLEAKDIVPERFREFIIQRHDLESVIDRIAQEIVTAEKPVAKETLTIAIVQTRKKYLNSLLHGLTLQDTEIKVDILDNFEKDKSIGQCYNILADRCTTDWICYVGDDDVIAEDYVDNVMKAYYRRQNMYKNPVALLTGSTLFDEKGAKKITSAFPTGFWKADFVRATRFDETLVRQVDTEFATRVIKSGKDISIIKMDWIVGYYYRQHTSNISGNKFTEGPNHSQEPVKK